MLKEKLLELLATYANDFFSGEKLATQLGVSRAMVWKLIQKLQEDGFEIKSVHKKGYRLLENEKLSEYFIRWHLCDGILSDIVVLDETDSTMNEAKQGALHNLATPALFITNKQLQTRGRFGRQYFSEDSGHGVYMSLLLQPDVLFSELPQYTILAAVAVVKAIEQFTNKQPRIKWVNDIYFGNQKFCGILSEATGDMQTSHVSSIIIGIGLNYAIESFPDEIAHKATSLFLADDKRSITRNQLIAEIWNQFFLWQERDFLSEYKRYSFVLGKEVAFVKKGVEYRGVAMNINDSGELIVAGADEIFTLSSGEISLTEIDGRVLRR